DESAEPPPVFEVVVTRERRDRALPQVLSRPALRGDVRGAPRGIERMAERCHVRRASPIRRSHPAHARAIEIALFLLRETGTHGVPLGGLGNESKNPTH